ncbi:hypothetical protein BURK_022015 [Burkholderia sp. SJ98]|uniref:DUF883 family protein n=1 Tax=Caballeronia TaxID=1827195 RepID=UPI00025BC0E6|nr:MULTISPECIES: DUF883 family protein [Caballeronia]EKS67753.1 hypothetical protein BURK_022015 [Burkholderia sp. SJ98]
MDNATGNASTIQSMQNSDRGDPADPPLSRRTVASAMDAALAPGMAHGQAASVTPLTPGEAHKPARYSPYHVHGDVLEGGDSPTVLAQPAATHAAGQGSQYHPSRPMPRRARDVLAGAQDIIATQYRQAKEGTDDYVHDNPWKSIALAAVGGLIVGLLAAR